MSDERYHHDYTQHGRNEAELANAYRRSLPLPMPGISLAGVVWALILSAPFWCAVIYFLLANGSKWW